VSSDVAILGAGLQGVCAALALEQRGLRVDLIEREPDCLLRASLRNEGKIHLGFVYAHDPSFETSALMLRASLRFAPLLEGWLGVAPDWDAILSVPFTYVIPRDSLLPREALLDHYERVQAVYEEEARDERSHYLGRNPTRLWRELPINRLHDRFAADGFLGAVETEERSIDLVAFREIVRAGLARRSGIRTYYGHRVEALDREAGGFRIEGVTLDGRTWKRESKVVVNCLWDARLAIDRQLGLLPKRKWVHRLKYRLLGDLPTGFSSLPSLTFALGRYGDIVVMPGRETYFSWYPSSMRGWCTDVATPASWEEACRGEIGASEQRAIGAEILAGFDAMLPGIASSRIDRVDAGTIFSWGSSDIDDRDSELHERRAIGIHEDDGYFSIDTGKLTCAPWFAHQLAKRLG